MTIENTIQKITADRENLYATYKDLPVTKQEELEQAGVALQQVTMRIKRIDELKKEFVQPLKDQVKKIEAVFNKEKEAITELEQGLRSSIGAYLTEQQRLAMAEQRKQEALLAQQRAEQEAKQRILEEEKRKALEELAQAKDMEEAAKKKEQLEQVLQAQSEAEKEVLPQFVIAPEKTVKTDIGTVSGTVKWKTQIIDLQTAFQAHPELFDIVPKVSALNAFAKSIGEEKVVDGMQIIQEVSTIVRTK